jgi:hydroxypyruvate isomerase
VETRLPKLSANLTFLFNELPFLERFGAAAAAGFDTVEVGFPYDWEPRVLSDVLAQNGLRLDIFNLPAGDFAAGERGTAVYPDRRAGFRAGVDAALGYAAALETRKLNCLVGNRDPSLQWDVQYRTMIENLTWAAARTGAVGVTLHVEQLCPAEAATFFLHSIDLAERLVDEVASPHLRIQFDVYHVQRAHGDAVSVLRHLIDRVGHVQVADTPGRGEPGSGELDYDEIFGELDRLGYAGTVGLEYRPTRPTRESLGWLEAHGWHGHH